MGQRKTVSCVLYNFGNYVTFAKFATCALQLTTHMINETMEYNSNDIPPARKLSQRELSVPSSRAYFTAFKLFVSGSDKRETLGVATCI